ncbi:ArsR/SmtB family transcription factor [Polycladidibacter stylochi]|uniref:ArsR/SmtB family transcription factor n=1 Tax=Polycladidibacter stylochi TaxID=1807766 RepID=UPI00082AB727|nr:ArsR family transcriptional regulator [Pseudovibrio stylochi]
MSNTNLKLSSLASRIRRDALRLVQKHEKYCLCDLAAALGVPQPSMTKHMQTLKTAGYVRARKEGQRINFSICENLEAKELSLLEIVLTMPEEEEPQATNK